MINPPIDEPGLGAEIGHLALSSGGETVESGFLVSALTFRLFASELGIILGRHGADAKYDEPVRLLLQDHIEEIEARRSTTVEKHVPERQIRNWLKKGRFNLKRELKGPQLKNLSRLLAMRHGANFSVPGAGKTTTLLALYEILHSDGKADRLLVVAPKNAFLSWEDEIKACFPKYKISFRRLEGEEAGVASALADDPEVCLITYQLLVNVHGQVGNWVHRHKTHLVLDESHRIKSGVSKVTPAAALKLSGSGVRRDILSGTPMPQSPEDLRPQMDFLWPGQRILPEARSRPAILEDTIPDIQARMTPLYVRTTKADLKLPRLEFVPISHEDPNCRVMIANPAACGEGISLHQACHYAIYVDRTFNAAHFLQSVDRIHRLGLAPDQETLIHILEARWTIDARVALRLKAKIDAMCQILNDPGLAALAYDPEDVVEEFPGGLEAGDVEEVVDHLVRDAD